MKKPAADRFANTTEHSVVIEGVRVNFRLDAKGKPLSVGAGYWIGERTGEREAKMAIDAIKSKLALAAAIAVETNRTATSAKTRRDAAQTHWSNEWLEAAHGANPAFGAGRLAQAARKMLATNWPEISAEKHDEITEHRAREYLKATRKKGKRPGAPGDV